MNKKMLVNIADDGEARVAIVEDGVLEELYIEAEGKEQTRGTICKGVVVNVRQSIQAAFVDYGGQRGGFLSMSDISLDCYINPEAAKRKGSRLNIRDVIKRGQDLVVQIVKEETTTKGASLTTYLSIAGLYLVLMPGSDSTRVSRKIEDEAERKKLKELLSELSPPPGMGFIIRTAGMNRTKSELQRDLHYLLRLWEQIQQKAHEVKAPALIYQEREIVTRFIRDYFRPDISEIFIDDKDVYKDAKEYVKAFMPRYMRRVKLYQDLTPIFAKFGIEDQVETAFQKKVFLKSGGSIVIEPTEAMVTIDVNSGKSDKEKGVEGTAYNTNMYAAEEIARQLRLRDLGGLIAIDFIDMKDNKHKLEVERYLRNLLRKDKARVEIGRISKFGILEMTRQRIRFSFQNWQYNVCGACKGEGTVPSLQAVSTTILRKIKTEAVKDALLGARVTAPLEVASYLLNQKRHSIVKIETDFAMKIDVIGSPPMEACQYKIEYTKGKSVHAIEEIGPEEEEKELAQTDALIDESALVSNDGPKGITAEIIIAQPEAEPEPCDQTRPPESVRRSKRRPARQRRFRKRFVRRGYQRPETTAPTLELINPTTSPEADRLTDVSGETIQGSAPQESSQGPQEEIKYLPPGPDTADMARHERAENENSQRQNSEPGQLHAHEEPLDKEGGTSLA